MKIFRIYNFFAAVIQVSQSSNAKALNPPVSYSDVSEENSEPSPKCTFPSTSLSCFCSKSEALQPPQVIKDWISGLMPKRDFVSNLIKLPAEWATAARAIHVAGNPLPFKKKKKKSGCH